MINITEIVQSSGWKKFMAKLYGWGAAVVLLGALFKIQHWTGANLMLTIGMLTEVVIFFFSAFEPIHEEVDWTLVYPELAGISEEDDFLPVSRGRDGGGGGFSKFDEMLEKADIGQEVFEKLGQGLKNLNKTTQNLMNISDVTNASNQYVDNLQAASESITSLAESYGNSTTELTNSVNSLTNSYQESSQQITESGQRLADQVAQTSDGLASSYQTFEEGLSNQLSSITSGNQSFGEKLESLNKNLSALNSAYELQLQTTNEHIKNSETVYKGMDEMMGNLKDSVDETKVYKEAMAKLNESISSLNSIYGNMLSAMNIVNK